MSGWCAAGPRTDCMGKCIFLCNPDGQPRIFWPLCVRPGRISPLRPTSAAKHVPGLTGRSNVEDRIATTTARSQAVSLTRIPPATLRKTSLAESLNPALFSSTASSMLSLRTSYPVAERWGIPYAAVDTRAWISIRNGLEPSTILPTATPLRFS